MHCICVLFVFYLCSICALHALTDVGHLRGRVEKFRFIVKVPALKDVESCAPVIAKWIRDLSDEDAPGPVAPGPPTHAAALPDFSAVAGFAGKMAAAELPGAIVADLFSHVCGLGAVDVTELSDADWQRLSSWKKPRPLEARRLAATFSE